MMERFGEVIAKATLAVEIRVVGPDGCVVFRFDPVAFRRIA